MYFAASGALYANCSLHVTVDRPHGRDLSVPVVVEEMNGWRYEQRTRGEVLKFCGLGFEPVSVTVGGPYCVQVVVRNLSINLITTTPLRIWYDDSSCSGESIPLSICTVLLRFADSKLTPIPGVVFNSEKPDVNVDTADEYGRLQITISRRKVLLGTASAIGYKVKPISIPCVASNYHVEKTIILEKSIK